MKQKPPLEKEVQKACLDWLNTLPNCRFWRRNTGAAISQYKGKSRMIRFSEPGQSDIWGILPAGIHCEIEVKRKGGKPSPEQQAWLEAVAKLGGAAFIADSLDACIEGIREHWVGMWRKSWEPK